MDTGPVDPVSDAPAPQSPVVVATQKQADGSYWVTVTHFFPGGTFQWVLSVDQAEAAAAQLYTNIRDAAAQGRRERSGLVVANSGFMGSNGRPKRERGKR